MENGFQREKKNCNLIICFVFEDSRKPAGENGIEQCDVERTVDWGREVGKST